MLNDNIIVQKSSLPFQQNFETLHLENCKTIREIVNKTIPFNFVDCRLVATLNNEVIESEKWSEYKLKKGDIVGLSFIPTGSGGGGSKNAMQVIVTIALVAATVWTAGAAGAAAGAWATAAGYGATAAAGFSALAQGAVYIAGSMIGSLAYSALASTPKQRSDSDQGMKTISSSSNEIDRYGIVPVNLGKNRIFPKQAALPFNETSGLDQYVRQLFTYGYGKLKISDRKLGETNLSDYDSYEIIDKLNGNLNEGTSLYTNDVYQESLSVNLKIETGYVIRTTQRDSDECEIVLTFPYGIYVIYGKNKNKKGGTDVKFGLSYRLVDTEIWSNEEVLTYGDLYTKTLIKTKSFKFPKTGQYEVRLRRLSPNSDNVETFTESIYTYIKSIGYRNPVKFKDISGTAIRIKATDQLNGSISTYNVIGSTLVKGYKPDIDSWVDDVESSNPADLFRYVLQSPAFAKRLPDEKIDLLKLVEWWKYCDKLKLTYNRYVDYEGSVDDVLNDICAAGVATLSKVNNIYSVIIDNERPYVKGIVTPRNSWDYKGNINYPEIPHGLRIEFRNAEKNYETDERIVYADGYNEDNATLYERLQFPSCTNADLAYWYGRRYYATALLQPETHTFKMDFENLTFNRGDRISLVNDVILVGVGQGRITNLIVDNVDNPTIVKGFFIDDELDIPYINNLGVRIRDNNGSGINYHLLENVYGLNSEFTFKDAVPYENAPAIGSLCAFVEDGKELDLIVTGIQGNSNQSATITAVNYAPERFNPIEEIPPFESNITAPSDFTAPLPPVLNGAVVSDESVMFKNADGSLISTMVIPLLNRNESNVIPVVYVKATAGEQWYVPSIFKKEPNEVIITGLDEGGLYDVKIRYQRQSGLQLLSNPLLISSVSFIGGSTPPKDVEGFKVTVTNGLGIFEWLPNDDIDISYYVIKFTTDMDTTSWESAQTAFAKVTGNTVTGTIHKGVYLIKAVDLSGNESKNATTIISDESGAFRNVVEVLTQEPEWLGRKENVFVVAEYLTLEQNQKEGYYYFNPEPLDLGEIYECSLSTAIKARIVDRNKVRNMPAIRTVGPLRDYGNVINIRTVNSIRDLDSVRTFNATDWIVTIEMNLSNDNETWTGWQSFTASQHTFRYCKFRLRLYYDDELFNIVVINASVTIDMPDRYESGEDVIIADANEGATITYKNSFWNNPAVNITVQDGEIDDRLEYIKKDKKGFALKIYNDTIKGYVIRSFDWHAAGYGKEI